MCVGPVSIADYTGGLYVGLCVVCLVGISGNHRVAGSGRARDCLLFEIRGGFHGSWLHNERNVVNGG